MGFQFSHHQIAPDLHVFRAHMGRVDLFFNSFLLMAERPVLIHTGSYQMWPDLKPAISAVCPLEQLHAVLIPHVEADESGALPLLMKDAGGKPRVIASPVGARQLMGMGIVPQAEGLPGGTRVDLGDRELELIAAPSEVHLWDGFVAYDQKTRTIFTADFLSQMGPSEPFAEVPNLAQMAAMAKGGLPSAEPFRKLMDDLLGREIKLVAPGHGSCFTKGIPELVRGYLTLNVPAAL